MILRKLTSEHPDIPAVRKLYEGAFPERERIIGMDDILKLSDQFPIELLGIYPDETPETFAGFFVLLNTEGFAYLVYFATCPEMRSTGIGSKAIKSLVEYLGDKTLLFSYESIYEESDNAEQRIRRRNFYLKNGFYETGWFTKMNGTEFILASSKEETDKSVIESCLGIATSANPDAPKPELYRK